MPSIYTQCRCPRSIGMWCRAMLKYWLPLYSGIIGMGIALYGSILLTAVFLSSISSFHLIWRRLRWWRRTSSIVPEKLWMRYETVRYKAQFGTLCPNSVRLVTPTTDWWMTEAAEKEEWLKQVSKSWLNQSLFAYTAGRTGLRLSSPIHSGCNAVHLRRPMLSKARDTLADYCMVKLQWALVAFLSVGR